MIFLRFDWLKIDKNDKSVLYSTQTNSDKTTSFGWDITNTVGLLQEHQGENTEKDWLVCLQLRWLIYDILASTRLAYPTAVCGIEQFIHVTVFFSCTSTIIRDIRTLNRHQHQMTCMIRSETAAFVVQDTVETRERSLYCRSRYWQQQQSPKCCRECWIHWNDVAIVIICLSDDRSPSNDKPPSSLWINSRFFCSSCEEVPKTCRAKFLSLKLCRCGALTAVYWLTLRSALTALVGTDK